VSEFSRGGFFWREWRERSVQRGESELELLVIRLQSCRSNALPMAYGFVLENNKKELQPIRPKPS